MQKKTKQSKKVFLIQTHFNDLFDKLEPFEGLIVLQSPSLQILNILQNGLTKVPGSTVGAISEA